MLAIEFPEQDGARAAAVVAAAREHGLLLLTCGLYGNVIRLLPPITIGDADLAEGLDTLEAALRVG
jgi:4-aminobutyrate aminotransferase-like enzyme